MSVRPCLSLAVVVFLSACGGSSSSGPDASLAPGDGATLARDAELAPADAATAPDADLSPDAALPGPDAGPRELKAVRVLGEGGFFGTSARDLGALHGSSEAIAIGAHYANLPDATGTDKAGGRVYLFTKGSVPTSLAEASEILEPPDLAVQGGFGWAVSNSCDLDKDGYRDLAIGSHLYSGAKSNAGRVIVFWGDSSGTFSPARTTIHALSAALQANSDCMGQTVLCADLDSDGVDDLLATGQNAGPSDTGMGAIFRGVASGRPSATQDVALYPSLAVKGQYFGSASLFEDLDGDGVRDLAIGAWGLIRGTATTGPHTGGFSLFKGGTDWTAGPAFQVTPGGSNQTQMGSALIAFSTPAASFLAATAGQYDSAGGAVLVYLTKDGTLSQGVPAQVLRPPSGMTTDEDYASAVAYAPDYFGKDQGALLVGAKYATAGGVASAGAVLVYAVTANGLGLIETPTTLTAPVPTAGDGFGGMIADLGDLDGDGLKDFAVGMPEHLEGDLYTGTQTGGVVFFH